MYIFKMALLSVLPCTPYDISQNNLNSVQIYTIKLESLKAHKTIKSTYHLQFNINTLDVFIGHIGYVDSYICNLSNYESFFF